MREGANFIRRQTVCLALVAPGVLLALSPFAGLAGGRLGTSEEGRPGASPVRQTPPKPAHPRPSSPEENQWEPIGPLALRHPEIFVCIGQAVTAETDRLKDWIEGNKLVDSEKFYQPIINACSKAYPDQAATYGRSVLETDITAVLEDWLKPRVDAALAAKRAKDEQLRKQAEADEERGHAALR